MAALRLISSLLICASIASAADYTLPTKVQAPWSLQTSATNGVGVADGIEQYFSRPAHGDANANGFTDALEGIDNTGATNVASTIQTAINAATSGTAVVIPNGTYRCDAALVLPNTRSNITLRGESRDGTIIDSRTSGDSSKGVLIGTNEGYTFPTTNNFVTSAKTRGVTSFTIGSATGFSGKQWMKVAVENSGDYPANIETGEEFVITTNGSKRARSSFFRITGVAGNVVSFWPPLPYDATGLEIQLYYSQLPTTGVGVENLTITSANSAQGNHANIQLTNCRNSWIYNVKAAACKNYNIMLSQSIQCTVQKFECAGRREGGSNGAGFLVNDLNTANLIWDGIIRNASPLFEFNFGSINNVIAYNLLIEDINNAILYHGPHPSHNLWEGNFTKSTHSDGYFGSHSSDTYYRNWISGLDQLGVAQGHQIVMRRFSRSFAFAGNIIGTDGIQSYQTTYGDPNFGGAAGDGTTAQPTLGDFWKDYQLTGTLTTRTSDTAGVITFTQTPNNMKVTDTSSIKQTIYVEDMSVGSEVTVTAVDATTMTFTGYTQIGTLPPEGALMNLFTGVAGWQEEDLDVEPSMIFAHNYEANAAGTGTVTNQLSEGTTLGTSMFLTAKPDWFGALDWPPFGPDTTIPNASNYQAVMQRIPAGYRYFNGGADPGEEFPASGRKRTRVGGKDIRIGGKVLKIGDN